LQAVTLAARVELLKAGRALELRTKQMPMKLERENDAVYFSDMSKCRPAASLSSGKEENRWRLIPYRTSRLWAPIKDLYVMKPDIRSPKACFEGTAAETPAGGNAGPISYPLNRKGWHAVFVGLTGRGNIRIGFSGDKYFTTFKKSSPDWFGYEEAVVGCRNLGAQDLVFAPSPETPEQSTVIVYIKLVPLTRQEIGERGYGRGFTAKERNLTVTRDDAGWANDTEEKMADAVLNQFINSPVKMLYFGMPSFGTVLNYEDLIRQGQSFCAGGKGAATVNEKCARTFYEAGDSPLACAVRLAHRAGVKIHFFQRPGRFADPGSGIVSPFYNEHPEWRLKNRHGHEMHRRMSVVFPEVRRYLVDCLRETLRYEPDGINICMTRGAPLALYEAPLIEEFRAKYRLAPTKLKRDDDRFVELRCEYTTQYIREVREMLDEERPRGKKRLELSVMVFGDRATNRLAGLDIEKWIELSLVDIVNPWHIPIEWPPTILGHSPDLNYWTSLRGGKTKIVPFARCRFEQPHKLAAKAYKKGFSEVAFWDINLEMEDSRKWQVLRKITNLEDLKKIAPGEWLTRVGYFEVFDGVAWDREFGHLFGAG
jgi:hypothetical protein